MIKFDSKRDRPSKTLGLFLGFRRGAAPPPREFFEKSSTKSLILGCCAYPLPPQHRKTKRDRPNSPFDLSLKCFKVFGATFLGEDGKNVPSRVPRIPRAIIFYLWSRSRPHLGRFDQARRSSRTPPQNRVRTPFAPRARLPQLSARRSRGYAAPPLSLRDNRCL